MEEYRDIKGYEGYYQISNLGNSKSLERKVLCGDGRYRVKKERILKPILNTYGYYVIHLSKDGIKKKCLVHRLVAEEFIDNPDNLPCINHKNEDKTDNRVENIEWCDDAYNCRYGTRTERIKEKTTNGKLSIPVLQYDLNGNFIKEWLSTKEVERELGYHHSNITNCCKGKNKTAYNYKWRYK